MKTENYTTTAYSGFISKKDSKLALGLDSDNNFIITVANDASVVTYEIFTGTSFGWVRQGDKGSALIHVTEKFNASEIKDGKISTDFKNLQITIKSGLNKTGKIYDIDDDSKAEVVSYNGNNYYYINPNRLNGSTLTSHSDFVLATDIYVVAYDANNNPLYLANLSK